MNNLFSLTFWALLLFVFFACGDKDTYDFVSVSDPNNAEIGIGKHKVVSIDVSIDATANEGVQCEFLRPNNQLVPGDDYFFAMELRNIESNNDSIFYEVFLKKESSSGQLQVKRDGSIIRPLTSINVDIESFTLEAEVFDGKTKNTCQLHVEIETQLVEPTVTPTQETTNNPDPCLLYTSDAADE